MTRSSSLLTCAGLMALFTPAQGAEFLVSAASDAAVRTAVNQANMAAGLDAIRFADGLAGQEIVLTGALDLTDDVIIVGPSNGLITLNGNAMSVIFDGALAELAFERIHFTNGLSGGVGGAVNGSQSLRASDCIFSDNEAATGGAIGMCPPVFG